MFGAGEASTSAECMEWAKQVVNLNSVLDAVYFFYDVLIWSFFYKPTTGQVVLNLKSCEPENKKKDPYHATRHDGPLK